ncbi:MAG: HD domain-containing protein [Candidatus Heimdallarchaeota archaeon]|nr:HD domain-containing protein [Candidatus Heimdallarchaeota archaeon]MCG3253175.1 HD domain-containing protein [Candidatus Heimdallarchaeota archaeon]MCK4290312.1 HD domain-containing protein [Candidatus Heimdallarchaeota archaeon]
MFENSKSLKEYQNRFPTWRLNIILTIIQKKVEKSAVEKREIPLVWSLMHMYSTMQIAKLLALKRGINPELAGLTCAFHDIHTLLTGSTKNHGVNAAKHIQEIVMEYNQNSHGELPEITKEEVEKIINAIAVHSDKNTVVNDPLTELLKDVDSLDSYLHGLIQNKQSGRIPRGNKVLKEFNIDFLIEE